MTILMPWVIDGAKHSARLFRREHQQNVGEGSGVARSGDFKVRALNTPGNGFRVAPGGGTAQSRDTSSSARESYAPVIDEQVVIEGVPGTGSGETRRDLVILEITDPEMESVVYPAPGDPKGTGGWLDGANFVRVTVIPGVGSGVTSLDQITTGDFANVTGITLAAINWLPSTSTIGNGAAPTPGLASIEDLRELQNPRRDGFTFARPRVGGDSGPQMYLAATMPPLTATGGELFPGGDGIPNRFQIKVPAYATRMSLDAKWMSLFYAASQNPRGRYWIEYGDEWRGDKSWPGMRQLEFATQEFAFNAPAIADVSSDNWLLMDEVPIPAKLRGKTIWIAFKAARAAGNATSVFMNSTGGLGCTGVFAERAIDADLL